MATEAIAEIKRVFLSRLDALGHILDVAEKHFGDLEPALQERLAPDMFPLGTQVAFACNQPRGFSQWCAGQPVENLPPEVDSTRTAGRTSFARKNSSRPSMPATKSWTRSSASVSGLAGTVSCQAASI
jgi:hypothetical protein